MRYKLQCRKQVQRSLRHANPICQHMENFSLFFSFSCIAEFSLACVRDYFVLYKTQKLQVLSENFLAREYGQDFDGLQKIKAVNKARGGMKLNSWLS